MKDVVISESAAIFNQVIFTRTVERVSLLPWMLRYISAMRVKKSRVL